MGTASLLRDCNRASDRGSGWSSAFCDSANPGNDRETAATPAVAPPILKKSRREIIHPPSRGVVIIGEEGDSIRGWSSKAACHRPRHLELIPDRNSSCPHFSARHEHEKSQKDRLPRHASFFGAHPYTH